MVRNNGRPFVRTAIETLSVVAMRISNPDCSPVRIRDCNAAPTPTGFAEIVSDYFPVLHLARKRLAIRRSITEFWTIAVQLFSGTSSWRFRRTK